MSNSNDKHNYAKIRAVVIRVPHVTVQYDADKLQNTGVQTLILEISITQVTEQCKT
jgi:hypothetical protein